MTAPAPIQVAGGAQHPRRDVRNLIRGASFLLCLLLSTAAHAQDLMQSMYADATRFYDPEANTYFWLRHLDGNHVGNTMPFTSLGGTKYIPLGNGVLMFDGQGILTNNAMVAGNLGVIGRMYAGNDSIVGASTWLDVGQSRNRNTNSQVGFGLEWLRCDWSARGNVYIPIGDTEHVIGSRSFGNPGTNNIPSFSGNNLVVGGVLFNTLEYAMQGADVELARRINCDYMATLEAFGGVYGYRTPFDRTTIGGKGGLRGYVANNVAIETTYSYDGLLGHNVSGGLTWFFGGSGGSAPCGPQVPDNLTRPVIRNEQIAVHSEERLVIDDRMTLTNSGADIFVMHVNSDGVGEGNGTFEDPFGSLTDANAANGAGVNIVYVHADSSFNNQSFTLVSDQRFLGEAAGAANNHLVMTDQLGNIVLPRATAGINAPLLRTTMMGANILTLPGTNANFAEVSVVRLDGSLVGARGISALNGANDTFINRTDIRNFATAGVEISAPLGMGSVRTTLGQEPILLGAAPVNFVNNATDVILDAQDTTIVNFTSTNSDTAIRVDNITGFAMLDGITINNALTGIVLNNAQNMSTVTATNVDINTITTAGMVVSNSQLGSSVTLTNFDIDGGAGVGVQVNGTVAGADVNIGTAAASDGFRIANLGGDGIQITNNMSAVGDITIEGDNGAGMVGDGIIQSVRGNGVAINNSNATINLLTIRDPLLDGIDIIGGDISRNVLITNNLINPPGQNGIQAVNTGMGTLTVTATDNMITSTRDGFNVVNQGTGTTAVVFNRNDVTSLIGDGFDGTNTNLAGALNLSINENLFTATTGAGILVGSSNVFTTSGPLNITGLFQNNIRDAGAGGILIHRATFDADLVTAGLQAVAGGDTMIGSLARVRGDGVRLFSPTGTLDFGILTVRNNVGTGILVDTKTQGTTFTLDTDAGSTVDTTNGAAMFLDPLTLGLGGADHFVIDSATSTNSPTVGVGFDTAGGVADIKSINVSGAGTAGLQVANAPTGSIFNFDTVVINSGNGVRLTNNNGTVNFNVNLDGTLSHELTINSSTGTGFFANNFGGGTGAVNFNVGGNAVNTIAAIGGAIDVRAATLNGNGFLIFDTVSSTNAAQNGVRFRNMTTGVALGPVTITDTLSNFGTSLLISNSPGVTFDFDSVSIDNTNGAAGGVSLTNNVGAMINFNRDLNADTMADLSIVTRNGIGFNATNGGTVNLNVDVDGMNTVSTSAGTAINVSSTALTTVGANSALMFDAVSSTNAEMNGVRFNNMTTGVALGPVTVTDTQSGNSLVITNSMGATFDFDSVTIDNTNGAAGGVSLMNNTMGSTINFNRDLNVDTMADLSILTSTGIGFSANNSGTVVFNFDTDGANSVTSTGATAINVANGVGTMTTLNTNGSFTFDTVNSTGGALGGVIFNRVASTTGVSIDTLTVTDAMTDAGLAIRNSIGGADFTFNSTTINNTAGAAAGVLLENNAPTSVIDFNGAGATSVLNVTTTAGTAFRVDNGGTVMANVPGAANSITSANATALSVNGAMSVIDLDFDQVNAGNGVTNPATGVLISSPSGTNLNIHSGTIRIAANGTGVAIQNQSTGTTFTANLDNLNIIAPTNAGFSFNFLATGAMADMINVTGANNTATVGGVSNMTTGNLLDGVNRTETAPASVNGMIEVNGNNKAL